MSLLLALALQAAVAPPSTGGPEIRRETAICPTNGSIIETVVMPPARADAWRPDGKPLGIVAPDPLLVCGDGFPLWKTSFAADEKLRVEAILASADYRAKVDGGSPYYRLYWLLKLDPQRPPTVDLWYILQQASWEVDSDVAAYRRIQAEMLAEIDAALANADPADRDTRFYALLMAANAERVLGRMEAARARLAQVPVARLGEASRAARDRARLADLIAANDRRIDPAAGRG